MNKYTATICLAATVLAVAGCEKPSNPTPPRTGTNQPDPSKNADNTAQNKSDRDKTAITPMDQSNTQENVSLTASIRRAVMDDSTLSTNAHNCKIITDKAGVVTLRGPVDSQAEKDSVQAKATAIAGVTRVDNQLEVKEIAPKTATPIDRPLNPDLAATVRQTLTDDTSIAAAAQDCTVAVDTKGVVTLRGTVPNQDMKNAIESKVSAIAGVTRVDNQLEIKTR